jgi:hypothetical protein
MHSTTIIDSGLYKIGAGGATQDQDVEELGAQTTVTSPKVHSKFCKYSSKLSNDGKTTWIRVPPFLGHNDGERYKLDTRPNGETKR